MSARRSVAPAPRARSLPSVVDTLFAVRDRAGATTGTMASDRRSTGLAAGQTRPRAVPTGTPPGAEGVAQTVLAGDIELDMTIRGAGYVGKVVNHHDGYKVLATMSIDSIHGGIPAETFAAYTPDNVDVQWGPATAAEREAVKGYVHELQKDEATQMLLLTHKRYPSLIEDEDFFYRTITRMANGDFFEVTKEVYTRVPTDTRWRMYDDDDAWWRIRRQNESRQAPYDIASVHREERGYTLMAEAIRRSLAAHPMVLL